MQEPVTRRRAVVGLAVGASLTLAACTADDDGEPSKPPVDADTRLVQTMASAIATQQALVQSAMRKHPARKRELLPLRKMHAAHLEALGGYEGGPIDVSAVGLARLVRSEQKLQRRLANAAVQAGSGSLAKLLASMSAAVAQQLAVLA